MKTIILVLCVAVAVCSADQYTTKYDDIDIDKILSNDRLLKPYLNCILRDGSCTADARELKTALPDALKTGCEKCSAKQRANAEKVIAFLAKNKLDSWNEILAKYDKENVYRTKYADQARRLGVPL